MRSPKARPADAPLNARNAGLRLREAAVNVRIGEIDLAEPEPLGLEIHPRRDGKHVGDHVTGHNKHQDEHDDDRTGFEGGGQR